MHSRWPIRALFVDLNNYARFPTLAVGYLVASLRQAGVEVEVLTPLSYGMPATEREGRETWRDSLRRRAYLTSHPVSQRIQPWARDAYVGWKQRPHSVVVEQTTAALTQRKPDVLLLSAYLDHYPSVQVLGSIAADHGVPVVLGGPAFNQMATAQTWLDIPGLTVIVGAESDHSLPGLVAAVVRGEELVGFPGVLLPDGRRGPEPAPLRDLAGLPIPDFSDFPWERYPNRILPLMTGRGCEWGRCIFCSDVTSVNGRTFRSRPPAEVLDELTTNARRHDVRDAVFLDIKLNSNLEMWRTLLEHYQRCMPGGSWVGTVHVGRGENGLSREEMAAAAASGMRRVSFGLETGSQRLNDRMAKGTDVDGMSRFIHVAYDAGISIRTTMMSGYPGETSDDIDQTTRFLALHERQLDRVRLSRFKAIPGTRFQELYDTGKGSFPGISSLDWNPRLGRANYVYGPASSRQYRRAKARLLRVVHRINRKPLRDGAEQFDGLM